MWYNKKNTIQTLLVLSALLFLAVVCSSKAVRGATIDELQQKIDERNKAIKALEKEIAEYQNQVVVVGKQADSLKTNIQSLDLSKKQIQSSVSVTENKIDSTNLQINKLKLDITKKQGSIEEGEASIANALKQINAHDSTTFIEALLSYRNLSTFWDEVATLDRFQANVQEGVEELRGLKKDLEQNKSQTEKKKADLVSLKNDLASQKAALEDAIEEKAKLLKATKNQEANYKALIADKQAKKEAFEQEMKAYEAELHIAIDPKSIPKTGAGVLAWPLDKVYITQYFGNTPFATANPQGYSGQGHNGIDLRAAIGTPVKAVMDGVVSGTGNTSLINGCYSYGKWVLVKHANGLSSLYAHLSVINVTSGQNVSRGETLALSGNTGYVTGPHLHLTIFATQGVRIGTIAKTIYCKGALLPISDTHAYLNPLSYLPKE